VPTSSAVHCPASGRRVEVAPCGRVACDRLRRTSTRRPLARDERLSRKTGKKQAGRASRVSSHVPPPVEARAGDRVLTIEDAGPPGRLPVLVHSGGGVPSSVPGRGAGGAQCVGQVRFRDVIPLPGPKGCNDFMANLERAEACRHRAHYRVQSGLADRQGG
jgi:hypothetical protein